MKIKFIGYFLIIIGIVGFFFFVDYNGEEIPYSNLWFFASILIVITGFFIILRSSIHRKKQENEKIKLELEHFKLSSKKIPVNLDLCVIKSNSYSELKEKIKPRRAQALDEIYNADLNVQYDNINQSVLIFEYEENGTQFQFYSPIIYKDEITLRFRLDQQKQTYIYVDPENIERYYFDVEFLYN